ncbi:hypothetical protein [Sinorhizobium fredii]|uniref:hypothetical protein n=1 Tax=Rhizobium fredii TaxID=380 RepID=UPI001319EE5E|nr:hypothetical protein [Sinorhizobium fredii]
MDFKMMMHIHARIGPCGTENPPYLRNRSAIKQTDKSKTSSGEGANVGSNRKGEKAPDQT